MDKRKVFVLFLIFGVVAFWSLSFLSNEKNFSEYRFKDQTPKKHNPIAPVISNEKVENSIRSKRSPAQDRSSPQRYSSQERLTRLSLLQKRRNFMRTKKIANQGDFKLSNGDSYRRVKDLVAIPKTAENENQYPNAQVVNNHFLVEEALSPGSNFPVVQNAKTGNYAVFTGVLKVMLHNYDDLMTVSDLAGARINKEYDHINTVFYKFDEYEATLKAQQVLGKSSLVKSSEIELLEYQRQSR